MRTPRREQGMSLWSMAILLFLVVFFGLLIVKLSGAYYDQFTLDSLLKRNIKEMSGEEFSETEFRARLFKFLAVNNLQINTREVLEFDTHAENPKIILDYEKRIHIIANVDVVLSFHEEYGL